MANRILLFSFLCAAFLCGAPLSAQYPQPLDDPNYADAQENVFLRDEVTSVTVTMDPADLQFLLANRQTDIYKPCTVQITNSMINETYLDVGIRPRGNSGRTAKKNPWKLSFNEFVPGRRFHGLKKMNLGGDAPDPTMVRSSTLFDISRAMGVPAPRTHHVWLEINDGSLVSGVFIHFEQVDEEFVKSWFGNDDGRLYKCRIRADPANLTVVGSGLPAEYAGSESYEEQLLGGDYTLLADFIQFLNSSSGQDYAAQLGDWLNVDGFLRAQATDMVSGQWDGYWIGGNNYYLYENTETGLLEYIPWDFDHSFGMDYLFFPIIGAFGTNFATKAYGGWGNGGFAIGGQAPPPLIERTLDVVGYDQVLKGYAKEVAAGPFHPQNIFPRIDFLKNLLAPLAFTGSFSNSSMDNGYDNGDFVSGFDFPANYNAFSIPATWGLRPFVERRREYVTDNYPLPIPTPRVYVNEVVADNVSLLADEVGEFGDWIELYNDESVDVDLSGWYLGDRPGSAREWMIPAGTIIPAKGHLIFWCDNDLGQGPLHTSFKLTAGGEGVHLWLPDTSNHIQADSMLFPSLAADESFGRFPDGTPGLESLAVATPSASNDQGGFALRTTGNCPGQVSLHAAGASSGGQVIFVASIGSGSFTIPGGFPCAGLVLGLDPATITLLGAPNADATGRSSISFQMPESLCDLVTAQAVDVNTCVMSSTLSL
ncbi:MAG: CotH kinase family protein [Planctomycetota bacterium]|jgi:hypothetical protein